MATHLCNTMENWQSCNLWFALGLLAQSFAEMKFIISGKNLRKAQQKQLNASRVFFIESYFNLSSFFYHKINALTPIASPIASK